MSAAKQGETTTKWLCSEKLLVSGQSGRMREHENFFSKLDAKDSKIGPRVRSNAKPELR